MFYFSPFWRVTGKYKIILSSVVLLNKYFFPVGKFFTL